MYAEEYGRKARYDAKEWLKKELKNGPRACVDVEKAAKDKKMTKAELRRALNELGVVCRGVGNHKQWALRTERQRVLFDKQHEDGLEDVQYD